MGGNENRSDRGNAAASAENMADRDPALLHRRGQRNLRRSRSHVIQLEQEAESVLALYSASRPPVRIRGSETSSNTSARKLPPTRNSAEKTIPPITRYRSRASVASSNNGPRPGHPVATSTSKDPLSREAIEKPKREIAGLAATGRTCRKSNRARPIPRPRPALTCGASITSITLDRTCLTTIARPARTRIVAGNI